MITVHSFEENIRAFNKMFNELNPDHYDRFTYIMAEVVVKKVEIVDELTKKLDNKTKHGNRLRDVQKWCKEDYTKTKTNLLIFKYALIKWETFQPYTQVFLRSASASQSQTK